MRFRAGLRSYALMIALLLVAAFGPGLLRPGVPKSNSTSTTAPGIQSVGEPSVTFRRTARGKRVTMTSSSTRPASP